KAAFLAQAISKRRNRSHGALDGRLVLTLFCSKLVRTSSVPRIRQANSPSGFFRSAKIAGRKAQRRGCRRLIRQIHAGKTGVKGASDRGNRFVNRYEAATSRIRRNRSCPSCPASLPVKSKLPSLSTSGAS